jgi:hypothetical protein
MADVNTQGIDFADIAGVVGGLAGTISPMIPASKNPNAITSGNVLKAVLGNPQLLSIVLGLFSSLGGLFKKKAQNPTIPVDVPPVHIDPPPVVTPAPVTPAPSTNQGEITSLREKYYFFERTEHGSQVLNKGTYDAILAGDEYLTRGDRIHLDITPFIGNSPLTPESGRKDELLLNDPTKGDVEQNHLFDYVAVVDGHEYHSGDVVPGQSWDGQDVVFLTSEYDDYGCTPVATVNRDLDLGREHTVSFYTIYDKNGKRVTGNKTPQIIVKPWAKS